MTEDATTETKQTREFISTLTNGFGSEKTSMDHFVNHVLKYERKTEQIFEWFDQYPFFEIRRACIAELSEIAVNREQGEILVWTKNKLMLFMWRTSDELEIDQETFEDLSFGDQEKYMRRRLTSDEDLEILRALFELALRLDKNNISQNDLIVFLKRERDKHPSDKMKTKEFYKLLFKNGRFKDNYTPELKEFILEELERLEPEAQRVSRTYDTHLWPVYLLTRIYKFIQITADVEILPEIKKYIYKTKISEEALRLSTYRDDRYIESWFELYGLRLTVRDILEARIKLRAKTKNEAEIAKRKLEQI